MKTDIIMKLTVNSMKIIAIMAIGFMTLSVNAQTFDVGEFEYKVIDGGVEVSKFKQMDDAPFVSIPASVEYESTVYDVIAILHLPPDQQGDEQNHQSGHTADDALLEHPPLRQQGHAHTQRKEHAADGAQDQGHKIAFLHNDIPPNDVLM